ncbi:MAG: Sulfate/thiosulfate import ATP-binding protein CysA [Syntrophus sp. PtaB.Bin075]|nr:MAG: Sulfate/thiosulfate import ATP-binding protein CysA [Syntrophus sp. PtaB.Bin075]
MIDIKGLKVHLGEFRLKDIDLSIDEGEFFVLMGPTGAGKTVLLEAIAGLVPILGGTISISGRDATRLAPEQRGVGIMYQDYALFPHLTVTRNITYGLRYQKRKGTSEKLFRQLVDDLGIGHLLHRYPETLSGGELQRVALARALMVEPRVILLDEPLSALDQNFREEIRLLLKQIHRGSRITFFMVTHDFSEALTLATKAAIMNSGAIVQTGTIRDIFQKPSSSFVANFVGMKNVFPTEFNGSTAVVDTLAIEVSPPHANSTGHIAIRPEDIVISLKPLESSMRNSFSGTVSSIIDLGFLYEVHVHVQSVLFKSLVTKGSAIDLGLDIGMDVQISFKSSAVHIF